MSKSQKHTPRMPATKFPQLQKKMRNNKLLGKMPKKK